MKKYFSVLFTFFIGVLIMYSLKVEAVMPLTGKIIVIDPGHGLEDPGTNYGNVYEKNINLSIGLFLEKELGSMGAEVILTRDGDYDLSTPNAKYRKKSDFDNRIKLINESNRLDKKIRIANELICNMAENEKEETLGGR